MDTAIFDGTPQELKDGFVSIIPTGRMGQPREIASGALFLASDDSSFVSGIAVRRWRHSTGLTENTNLTPGIYSIFNPNW
jgi:NAD(P)-dependent dehydrogenase (short-subunit alcohol dehydrogenase family)